MPITRTPIIDDDGTGRTGTVLDNAWKQQLYDQIDGLVGYNALVVSAQGFISSPSQPRTMVTNGANVTLPNGVVSAVPFSTEIFDVGNAWQVSNPTALFVPGGAAGLYLVLGQIVFAANAAGGRMARLRISGAGSEATVFTGPNPGDITQLQVMALTNLAEGDYVQLLGFQSSGAPLDALAGCRLGWVKLW